MNARPRRRVRTKATATRRRPRRRAARARPPRAAGARNSPVVQGSLTYQGTPAVAYVFVVNGQGIAVVERFGGCATLIKLTL